MKLKTIFWIAAVLTALQMLPLIGALFSPDIKAALVLDAFGFESLNPDASLLFDTFILVVGCIVMGIFFMIIGITSIEDLTALKRLSFLLFVVMGFFALPDLINAFAGKPTAPLPVIILNMAALGLLLYGSKKGTI